MILSSPHQAGPGGALVTECRSALHCSIGCLIVRQVNDGNSRVPSDHGAGDNVGIGAKRTDDGLRRPRVGTTVASGCHMVQLR